MAIVLAGRVGSCHFPIAMIISTLVPSMILACGETFFPPASPDLTDLPLARHTIVSPQKGKLPYPALGVINGPDFQPPLSNNGLLTVPGFSFVCLVHPRSMPPVK